MEWIRSSFDEVRLHVILGMYITALIGTEVVDSWACPRVGNFRSISSLPWRLALWSAMFGLSLSLIGNFALSAGITVSAAIAVCISSNLKFRVLGEPLVFSDATSVVAIFQFPSLFLFAMPLSARIFGTLGIILLAIGIDASFVPQWLPHQDGLLICGASILMLWTVVGSSLMQRPDLEADIARHGVALTMFLYWRRWAATRRQPFPAVPAHVSDATAELIVIIQNESFCDPQEICSPAQRLPSLARARESAWAWGDLAVGCFGGYTMRTEYGVLCGVEESSLGFSRYNPYLIAGERPELALPTKFLRHRCVFVHPYDLNFFGRNRLMKQFGFAELISASAFTRPTADAGYITDRTLTQKLVGQIQSAGSTLFYTVTMENHGPWPSAAGSGKPTGLNKYLHHLDNADAMLGELMDALLLSRRSAVLAFFGDHRPSIPGFVEDGQTRHTPYVLLRFDSGECVAGPGRTDQTPAALHHAIRACAAIPAMA